VENGGDRTLTIDRITSKCPCAEILDFPRSLAPGESGRVKLRIEHHGETGTVRADAQQVEQAIMNLVVNARDAMPEGGEVRIATRNTRIERETDRDGVGIAAGDYVEITVTDQGGGIPEEVITSIFEPFFTTKAVGEGSGLGLSMVYGFVRQSGGHVKIYSELGEGTAVKMYFPRALAAENAARPEGRGDEEPRGDEHVLVTAGSEGAYAVDPDGTVRFASAPPPRPLVDTVGAGDAFSAAVLLGLHQDRPLDRILDVAAAFASRTCTLSGATTTDRDHYRLDLEQPAGEDDGE